LLTVVTVGDGAFRDGGERTELAEVFASLLA
jgi:hypothetical protein